MSSTAVQRRGDWMQTYTGRQFYPMDPRPEDVDPVDIAHALAMICRFGGHVRQFYSVAEHCVLMSRAVPEQHALYALLHDATEAYVGDMIRPLKGSMPKYRVAEDRVMAAIAERFGLACDEPSEVKTTDYRILLTERDALMVPSGHAWDVDVLEPLPVAIAGWYPHQAERKYIARLLELGVDVTP